MTLIKNEAGKLDGITFPGGYSIRYICADGDVVCSKCANEWLAEGADAWEGQEPTEGFIDWEGPTNQCANCNEDMPTEYGDPEAEVK
jgi:hypothetical protein